MTTRHPIPEEIDGMAERIRTNQLRAVETLLGSPLPTYVRVALRAFEASLTPAIIEHERTPA